MRQCIVTVSKSSIIITYKNRFYYSFWNKFFLGNRMKEREIISIVGVYKDNQSNDGNNENKIMAKLYTMITIMARL